MSQTSLNQSPEKAPSKMTERTGVPPRQAEHTYEVVVAGAGLAGICAAIAAARTGARTVLLQDRGVLGGNASSEIRVCICGARRNRDGEPDDLERETGIIEDILHANRLHNPQNSYSILDHIYYDFVSREPNLDLMLNTSVTAAETSDGAITVVVCYQTSTETTLRINGRIFIDCSGDGLMAASAGALYRTGREAAAEFNESYATPVADGWQMGATIMLSTRDMGEPVAYEPPSFAIPYDVTASGRKIGKNLKEGFWWLELGSDDDIIAVQETNRHKLMGYLHGIWDHIKNSGRYPQAANLALEWVGSVPGKRESRRFMGDHILSQNDLTECRIFPDAVAFGGWPIDEHCPGGIESPHFEATSFHFHFQDVYQIPFRSLYSKNITNLLFAGRNISQTHIALSSSRVMATCAVMGQAVGTAAAICLKKGVMPRQLASDHIGELQEQLLRDDAYIPYRPAKDPADLARQAVLTASSTSSGDVKLLIDGVPRDEREECHHWESVGLPAHVELRWESAPTLSTLELKLDSDVHFPLWKRMKAMEPGEGMHDLPVYAPVMLKAVRLEVLADGAWKEVARADDIRTRRVCLRFPAQAVAALRIVAEETRGHRNARLFEVRCYGA